MREAHCTCIDGWISGEQSINLSLHIVVRRNDVEEVFDDAEVKIDAERIGGQSYPATSHTVGKHRTYCVLLVPNTGMVTTGIAGQSYNGKPRLERCYLQAKSPCNTFLDSCDLNIAEDIGDDSEGQNFSQYPGWRVCIRIGLLEVNDKIFA